jgi:hypothetical protein
MIEYHTARRDRYKRKKASTKELVTLLKDANSGLESILRVAGAGVSSQQWKGKASVGEEFRNGPSLL